jgi:hypothetical protein
MGSVGTTLLVSMLVATAIIAALCGFAVATVAARNRRRARGYFLLGFCVGLVASGLRRNRRRGRHALRFVTRAATLAASHLRLQSLPSQCHRYLRL